MPRSAKDVFNLLYTWNKSNYLYEGVHAEDGPGCSCEILVDFYYKHSRWNKFLHLIGPFIGDEYHNRFERKDYPAIFVCVLTDKQLSVQANQDFIVGMNAQLVYSYIHEAHGNRCNLFLIDKAAINWDYIYDILKMELENENN